MNENALRQQLSAVTAKKEEKKSKQTISKKNVKKVKKTIFTFHIIQIKCQCTMTDTIAR